MSLLSLFFYSGNVAVRGQRGVGNHRIGRCFGNRVLTRLANIGRNLPLIVNFRLSGQPIAKLGQWRRISLAAGPNKEIAADAFLPIRRCQHEGTCPQVRFGDKGGQKGDAHTMHRRLCHGGKLIKLHARARGVGDALGREPARPAPGTGFQMQQGLVFQRHFAGPIRRTNRQNRFRRQV